MNELKLPVPKRPFPDPDPLSMDDYARLVLKNIKIMKQLSPSFQDRKEEFVNVPFHLE